MTAEGKRVFENRVPEVLESTASRTIRLSGYATLDSTVAYSGTSFSNKGPLPPVADEETTYTLVLSAESGGNDLTNTTVTATLPSYIEWLGKVSSGDDVTYDSTHRTITWNIGNMSGGRTETAEIQIAFTPSASQVGSSPTLIDTQYLKAIDRFTETVVRGSASAITTAYLDEGGQVQP